MMKYTVRSKVWKYPGMAAWYFVNVDKKQSAEIKEKFGTARRGFGSVRVEVKLGKTKWKTSIFPDKQSGMYLLPVKAAVRHAEALDEGDGVTFTITPAI